MATITVAESTRVRAQTTNQPDSRFPWTFALDRAKLAELLGWDPDGATVRAIYDSLSAGRGVEVFTAAVPAYRGTGGVAYALWPLRDGDDGRTCPEVAGWDRYGHGFEAD